MLSLRYLIGSWIYKFGFFRDVCVRDINLIVIEIKVIKGCVGR